MIGVAVLFVVQYCFSKQELVQLSVLVWLAVVLEGLALRPGVRVRALLVNGLIGCRQEPLRGAP